MMNLPDMRTQVHRYTVNQLSDSVERGEVVLPAYQRGLVWEPDQAIRLIQSVYDGFPIGALLFWERKHGEPAVLLDGQQRVQALTGMRPGEGVVGPQVGWSMEARRWGVEPVSETDTLVTLHDWLSGGGLKRFHLQTEWRDKYGEEAWEVSIRAIDRVVFAQAPVHLLERATAKQAVEAFRRLNVEGTPFDPDDLERLLELESRPKHWLLFAEDMEEPIGCTQGAETADEAVKQALPEKEWDEHTAREVSPSDCPNCRED